MSDPMLSLTGIEKVYNRDTPGQINVLRGVTLNLMPGEAVALVAPSGAGKSTLLHIAGVASRADHRPAALSGGEQQRVAFCRALANTPRILLADEPTGNLDPETSDRVFAVLMDLVRQTGLAALIATHNMELAARMDRVVRLDGGVLVEG